MIAWTDLRLFDHAGPVLATGPTMTTKKALRLTKGERRALELAAKRAVNSRGAL